MTAGVTEPWWVPEQRAAKADKIAARLREFGATAADVVRFRDDERREAEAAAAVRKGSDATWTLVVDMLAGSTRTDARCPTCLIGDPLGEPGPAKAYGHDGGCVRASVGGRT